MISYLLSDTFLKLVLLNVILGYFSALKKSSDFRWPSRFSFWVLMLPASAVNEAVALAKSVPLVCTCPAYTSNEPVTSEITRCVTLNLMLEWAGSMVHLVWAVVKETLPKERARRTSAFFMVLK